ncbi:unnamed protein product [Parnassius mnemosyne]|uniref:DUF659 domain-containing protein n=1 Tax=Parnassius mnemosyne TaxID=213953 RepID=A0AAV1MB59_9NEOP
MQQHLLTCFKCPQAVKKQINDVNKSQSNLTPESTTTSLNSENTSTENIRNLREEFAKALLITGTPLAMVEHPLWVKFFEKLNFKLPNRKSIATKYLEKIYKEMNKEISDDLKASNFLHLQCDGWTDVCNEGIINFLISKPEPVFIKSLNTLDNRHTSEYLSCETEKVMKSYGVSKFVVLIGDNARNVQKSFERIKNKYPHIVPLNCAAHTMNLLCVDVIKAPEVKAFIDLATDVIKNIKKSQILSALLSKIRKEKSSSQSLKLSCKTRWGSHVSALKSLKINKAALQTLAVNDNLQPTPDIKSTLLNEDFWSMIEQSISVLEPIAESIFKLEGNEFNIHEVFMVLRNLKSKLEFVLPTITMLDDESKENIKTYIERRVKQCIKPIHYAAYMFDPKAAGIELNHEDTVPDRSDMEDTDDDMLHDAAMEGQIQEDMESSLREDIWNDMEPVASTSRQTNHIEFVNISECLYDTDSD